MISVAEATARLLSLVDVLPSEQVPLRAASGRIMAGPLTAQHDQPPFPASAMDGYAIAGNATAGDMFRVIGTSAAGHPFGRPVAAGEAVRIFTGAPLPDGATRVVIQEDIARNGDGIRITTDPGPATHIRPAAGDFAKGMSWHPKTPLGSRDVTLLAAMGHNTVPVVRKPVVAFIMTGDELRMPGETLNPGQITASNGFGLAAMVEGAGADARLLPIARDTVDSLEQAFALARDADLIVTIGGASVGDHDLVAGSARDAGLDMAFHKVAMRPGKPLLAGRIGSSTLIGLPGNPVSSMVCGVIFILPLIRRMLGLPPDLTETSHVLAASVPANGPRQHYMRGRLSPEGVVVEPRQDSSLLSVLARADLLVVRPPDDPALPIGHRVRTVMLPR